MTQIALSAQAITAALASDWKEAIKLNLEILKEDKSNIDALNRLGFAYLRDGNPEDAKKHFQKVIKLDPYNQIALKNLTKATNPKLKNGGATTTFLSPLIFLEDPGKTKTIACVHTAPEKILALLTSGQEVFLRPKKHCVEVRDGNDTYLGALPDDISFKLIRFLAGGNTYLTVIKSVGKNALTVFIREQTRGKKFAQHPSFITTAYSPFARADGALGGKDKPDITVTGEEDEEDTSAPDTNE